MRATFEVKENIVGVFEPLTSIVMPLDCLINYPRAFTNVLWLVLENSGIQEPVLSGRNSTEYRQQTEQESGLDEVTVHDFMVFYAMCPHRLRRNSVCLTFLGLKACLCRDSSASYCLSALPNLYILVLDAFCSLLPQDIDRLSRTDRIALIRELLRQDEVCPLSFILFSTLTCSGG